MKVEQTIQKALDENPEIGTVLRIAACARELEARELPREIRVTNEVVAIPTNPQCAV
jgi:hypothetical protein